MNENGLSASQIETETYRHLMTSFDLCRRPSIAVMQVCQQPNQQLATRKLCISILRLRSATDPAVADFVRHNEVSIFGADSVPQTLTRSSSVSSPSSKAFKKK